MQASPPAGLMCMTLHAASAAHVEWCGNIGWASEYFTIGALSKSRLVISVSAYSREE
jgi:hypothetical protein